MAHPKRFFTWARKQSEDFGGKHYVVYDPSRNDSGRKNGYSIWNSSTTQQDLDDLDLCGGKVIAIFEDGKKVN